jgi:hypothetical protein
MMTGISRRSPLAPLPTDPMHLGAVGQLHAFARPLFHRLQRCLNDPTRKHVWNSVEMADRKLGKLGGSKKAIEP